MRQPASAARQARSVSSWAKKNSAGQSPISSSIVDRRACPPPRKPVTYPPRRGSEAPTRGTWRCWVSPFSSAMRKPTMPSRSSAAKSSPTRRSTSVSTRRPSSSSSTTTSVSPNSRSRASATFRPPGQPRFSSVSTVVTSPGSDSRSANSGSGQPLPTITMRAGGASCRATDVSRASISAGRFPMVTTATAIRGTAPPASLPDPAGTPAPSAALSPIPCPSLPTRGQTLCPRDASRSGPGHPRYDAPAPGGSEQKEPQIRNLTCGSSWSRLRDSNPRPTHYECVALAI